MCSKFFLYSIFNKINDLISDGLEKLPRYHDVAKIKFAQKTNVGDISSH